MIDIKGKNHSVVACSLLHAALEMKQHHGELREGDQMKVPEAVGSDRALSFLQPSLPAASPLVQTPA